MIRSRSMCSEQKENVSIDRNFVLDEAAEMQL